MAGALEDLEPAARNRLMGGLAVVGGDDRVPLAPDDQDRHPLGEVEPVDGLDLLPAGADHRADRRQEGGPALGVGVALLRHHLYDIEVIIRRTLVYSTLSGLLALTYFGLVIVLQAAATALPAPAAPYGGAAQVGGARSEWVTVASTLAVAALFAPLRGRVQAFIDRRFYRQKYDAARVLSAFAAAARDETDLNALTGRLTGVVRETMEPEGLSVWLSQTAHDRSRTTDDDQPSVVHRLSSPAGERL